MPADKPNRTDKPNKHELRTRQTRDLLLSAAEKIFVRDGYEGAELGEIAALAGRTKGAIYAQFKSKEEIFLALIRDKRDAKRAEMNQLLAASPGVEENQKALRRFYINLMNDPAWLLLQIEFKLFAIRHPESRPHLQKFYDESIPGNPEKRYAELIGPAGRGKDAVSRTAAVYAFSPLLSALAVEASYAPDILDASTQKKIVARLFDALFDPTSSGS